MAHQYIIGQSGVGKTSLMYELIKRDPNRGLCVLDTTGQLTEHLPEHFLFDPATTRWNPFSERIQPEIAPTFFAQSVKDAYGYDDMATPVMSMYLSFLAAAIIENRRNLTNAPDFLTDRAFRDTYRYSNPLVQSFWDSFEELNNKDKRNETASTFNKLITVLLDPRVHRLFSVNKSFSLLDLTDQMLVVRLPLAQYGRDSVLLIGSLVLSYLFQILSQNPKPYSIYVEDAQLFAPATLRRILTENTPVSLTVSHQYIDQLEADLFAAIRGNCSKQYIFRVSKPDAELLSNDFPPMSSKTTVDCLKNHAYRVIPYNRYAPDGKTVPIS